MGAMNTSIGLLSVSLLSLLWINPAFSIDPQNVTLCTGLHEDILGIQSFETNPNPAIAE